MMKKMFGILAVAALLCMVITACAEKKTEETPAETTESAETEE